MKNFYLDFYDDLDDLHDPDGILELDVPDEPYIVTGCDPSEYELDEFDDLPF